MNKALLKIGTLCLMLLSVLTGKAATVDAVWDFSGEFASFTTIQGNTGTFTKNGLVLTVDATNGKFAPNGNSAQVNAGTRILVPVVSTDDVVSYVAFGANYAHFTIGSEDFEGEASVSHKATAAEVNEGHVEIVSVQNNSYVISIAVTQQQPEPVLEEDLVAMWDWQHSNPADLPDVHYEGNSGTVASTVEGVVMFVDASHGKLKGRKSDAQFNANTILQIPVKSAKDIVEVTTYPNYGKDRISVGGDVATGDVTTHKATTAEVGQGYVEVKGIQECYLYKVQVTFVSPLQEKALYTTDFTDWPEINRKQATGETVTVTTDYSHEDLTFTLTGVGADPAGNHDKFSSYTGYMISAKYPGEYAEESPYVITSPLASLTKMEFTQCATGGNRGWVIAVKGDGDEDWVPIFNQSIATQGGETHTLDINRKNAQLKFYNYNEAQNSYMVDLKLYGKVDLSKSPTLAYFTANGITYQAADVFNENADGNMEATIEISKNDAMISAENPIEAVAENGEVGEITYATADDKTVVTIPVEFNGETATYIVNATWKPDFTITYMNGETEVGKQVVEKDAAIGEFAFTADDVTVEDGNKFRGWCFADDGGQKATESTVVTGDMNLYALVTDIEGDDPTERNSYDFRQRYFYPEDHEALSIEGTYSYNGSQHGYDMKPGTLLKVYVAGNATIVLSNCRYGGGDILVKDPNGEQIGTITVPADDGALSSVNYEGEAGWVTLEMTAQSYIHYVNVINTGGDSGGLGPITPVNGYYIAKAGDINSLLNILDVVTAKGATGERVKIFLPDGTYDMGKAALTPIPFSNISIIGQSMDKTIIKNAPDVKNEGIGTTATFLINGGIQNTYFQDLTLQNALDYYSSGAAGRAVCLQDKGNRTIAKNMRMLSYQDTYYSNNNNMQAYWEDCDVHGTVDFLCGGGDVRFQNTTLTLEPRNLNGTGGRTITAATTTTQFGYVFDGCKIVDLSEGNGEWNFGRTWQNKPIVVFLNTVLDNVAEQTIISTRWIEKGMNNTDVYIFGEYNTMNEATVNITPESNIVNSYNGSYETILTAEQAEAFTYEKMFSENAKAWDPAALAAQVDAPKAQYANGQLTWTSVAEATAYAIFKNDVFVTIVGPETTSYELEADLGSDVLSIRSANEMGGFGEPAIVSATTLTLDENQENELPETPTIYNVVNVKRTIYGGMWNTICLPFDVTAEAMSAEDHPFHGATIMELSDAEYDKANNVQSLSFDPVDEMEATSAYLIKVDNDIVDPVFYDVTVDNALEGEMIAGNCSMIGKVNPTVFTEADDNIFFLTTGNKFCYVAEPGTMKGMRAYFTFDLVDDYANLTVTFDGVDGISNVTNAAVKSGELYDLQGRKLNNVPMKGVYIMNGRKYVK